MTKQVIKRLLDALAACQAIEEFVSGKDYADYCADQMLRSAVERQFEIVGEALNQARRDEGSLATAIPDLERIIG